ncbi:unnamed protein product, partial [Allacma fusca]
PKQSIFQNPFTTQTPFTKLVSYGPPTPKPTPRPIPKPTQQEVKQIAPLDILGINNGIRFPIVANSPSKTPTMPSWSNFLNDHLNRMSVISTGFSKALRPEIWENQNTPASASGIPAFGNQPQLSQAYLPPIENEPVTHLVPSANKVTQLGDSYLPPNNQNAPTTHLLPASNHLTQVSQAYEAPNQSAKYEVPRKENAALKVSVTENAPTAISPGPSSTTSSILQEAYGIPNQRAPKIIAQGGVSTLL